MTHAKDVSDWEFQVSCLLLESRAAICHTRFHNRNKRVLGLFRGFGPQAPITPSGGLMGVFLLDSKKPRRWDGAFACSTPPRTV